MESAATTLLDGRDRDATQNDEAAAPSGGATEPSIPAELTHSERARASRNLTHRRYMWRTKASKAMHRLRHVLVQQRTVYLQSVQSGSRAEASVLEDVARLEVERERSAAYECLRGAEARIVAALEHVRRLEIRLDASLYERPAVFAVGISAPASSWMVDEWSGLAPLPTVTACLRRVAVAALEPHFATRLAQIAGLPSVKSEQNIMLLPKTKPQLAAFFANLTRKQIDALASANDLPLHTMV